MVSNCFRELINVENIYKCDIINKKGSGVDLNDKKPEILLIISAVIVIITAMMYSLFDSPKYNPIQTVEITMKTVVLTVKDTEKININTADIAELMELSEIGEKRAAAIIEYRVTNGSFRSVEELTNISGITEAILAANKDKITV